MNRDQVRGASRHLKGRVQTALGGLTGDPAQQVRGAANQLAGGAQHAYGRARDQAEDLVEDGRRLARRARERADAVVEDGRHAARAVHRRGQAYRQRAARYADGHRTNTLIGLAALAFAAGWLVRRSR